MGIGRTGILWSVGLLFFLASFPAHAAKCGLLKIASFPIFAERTNAVTVPIAVNGATETFLVDTGGIYSSLTKPTVEALHLKPQRVSSGARFYMADGTMLDHYVTVDTLGIGPAHARWTKMLVDPGSAATGTDTVQGILAANVLRNFDLDFDFAHRTLNLISPKHCEGQVVYWTRAYAVVPFALADDLKVEVPVTLDGHAFKAIIDTGSSRTAIRLGAAVHDFGLTPESPGMIPVRNVTQNSVVLFRYRFKTLVIGGITVSNPLFGILSDAESKRFWKESGYDWLANDPIYGLGFKPKPIVLGLDILKKLHIYISYDEKKLYVTAAGRPGKPSVAGAH